MTIDLYVHICRFALFWKVWGLTLKRISCSVFVMKLKKNSWWRLTFGVECSVILCCRNLDSIDLFKTKYQENLSVRNV